MTNTVTDVAADLASIVRTTAPRLQSISETDSNSTRGSGTWSRKQILGHLIDSALNNLHRFVRAQQVDELKFPGYDQPFWVDQGGYQDRPWAALVGLWTGLNEHLSAVILRIHADRLQTPCIIGDSKPLALEFIVRDYVRHLRHHLEQILEPEGSKGKTHPPFGSVKQA